MRVGIVTVHIDAVDLVHFPPIIVCMACAEVIPGGSQTVLLHNQRPLGN